MSIAPSHPLVSVIIPCLNDAATLGEVLSALRSQTYPADRVEILVVDNGSTDKSRAIAVDHNVVLLDEYIRSAYVARNRAIGKARGDYLLFLDADTIPCAVWIEELVRVASTSETGMAGGRIENRIDGNALGSALLALLQDPEKRRASVEQDGRLSGGNMIIQRNLFSQHGLFLELQSGADGEFSTRANPHHRPIPYAGRAVVRHVCNISTRGYLQRAFREARGQAMAAPRGQHTRPPLPWKPGFRRALELSRKLTATVGFDSGVFISPRIFVVLWLERWFFFFGSISGRMVKR